MAQLPVEIFEIITRYLTRADVKALRLVCREFEAKVSAQYFRNVVVPFRAELYTNLDHDENGDLTSRLFTNGMRIFESFGPHILRFALSLELDEFTLAYPPVKPAQEAVPAFWGVYRWPHETYHRYTDLEGLEQTADETDGMKKALRCLTKVNNLGLCCDAGLGFLVGPDQAVRKMNNPDPVFDVRDWRQDNRSRKNDALVTVADFNGVPRDLTSATAQHDNFKRRVLEKMISDAGFAGFYIHEAIDLLLETEGVSISNIDFDEREVAVQHRADNQPEREPAPDANNRQPLIPTNLTRAQKELLLELEWAHRAMIQSYVISIIDNAGDGCFSNLTNVTIAKIPSAHVHILCRKELWESIPSVKNVSLGVIADWRKISKPSPGVVEDIHVSPVEAVSKVYPLLNDYIGRQPNIESLRFEWICGGEFARGPYQRNQYILPAPLAESPDFIISPDGAKDPDRLLSLPFVKHFSLKNCWASPHVFFQTIRAMALQALDTLELESVSFSGPPKFAAPPANAALGAGNAGIPLAAFAPGIAAPIAGPPPMFQPLAIPLIMGPDEPPLPERLVMPKVFTWAGFCEHFSPGIKIRHLPPFRESSSSDADGPNKSEDLSPFLPEVERLKFDEGDYCLRSISFKSCGYVFVDVRTLDLRQILPTEGQAAHAIANGLRHDLFHSMQYCKDKFLARILPYLPSVEAKTLEHVFLMEQGWSKVYGEQVCEDAIADGFDCPGMGRFSGTIKGLDDVEVPMMIE
ncbi:hypothetical protein Trco_008096 [Trichoderma cornu-damae]|uniref:F-box domain-containing protein n=1 Tax=Trichoderma cornu-damae TaxID=654480 RepID=A0A9P8TRB2_9HYPO|nr:hypothetical protein Trco_008096 [Trichoderma cornu-damae]